MGTNAKSLFFFIFLFTITVVSADVELSEYDIIVEENGNAVILITLHGTGTIDMKLPNDVETLNVNGGLYLIEDSVASIAIGSGNLTTVIYKTSIITSKTNNLWELRFFTDDDSAKNITLFLPEDVIISKTVPTSLIQTDDITAIYFGDSNEIQATYSFPHNKENNEEDLLGSDNNPFKFLYYLSAILVLAGIFILFNSQKSKKEKKKKIDTVLHTLTDQERSVVDLLIQAKKPMKRSHIEKKLEIAKSSLAATLNNLERKKILKIDKTFTTHVIKLEDWIRK